MNIVYEQDGTEDEPQEVYMTLEELNEMRLNCKEIVDRSNSVKKLLQNEDFNRVITEGYLKSEAVRLGLLVASGRMPTNAVEGAINDLKSIGSCSSYLNKLMQDGQLAEDDLKNAELTYNEVTSR